MTQRIILEGDSFNVKAMQCTGTCNVGGKICMCLCHVLRNRLHIDLGFYSYIYQVLHSYELAFRLKSGKLVRVFPLQKFCFSIDILTLLVREFSLMITPPRFLVVSRNLAVFSSCVCPVDPQPCPTSRASLRGQALPWTWRNIGALWG